MRPEQTSTGHFGLKYSINKASDSMRNNYKSLDHNSPYYYKHFLDAFIPAIITAMATHEDIETRYSKVLNLFEFDSLNTQK